MQARQAICYAAVSYFYLFLRFISDHLSQNLPDRSSPNFLVGRTVAVDDQYEISCSVPRRTLPWQQFLLVVHGCRSAQVARGAGGRANVGLCPPSTPWVKKTRHLTLAHNFTKYLPIFKILSLLDPNRKFVTKSYTNTPPHPNRVASLPCEISVFKNRHS